MSVEPFGLFVVLLGCLCLVRGYRVTAATFIVMALFGSAAAGFIGNNTLQPAHVFLAFLACAVLSDREARLVFLKLLHPRHPAFLLVALVAYSVVMAWLLPRVLAGTTEIIPLGVTEFGEVTGAVPLVPGSSNITQSIYMTGNLLCFLLIAAAATQPDGFRAVVTGVLAYAALTIVFALVDLATYATGTADILSFMRNAKYTLHNDTEVSGLKRIVGSFTETSVFARSTLGVLGFAGTLWLCGWRWRWTGLLAAASIILLVLSTSSTAIVGLPVMAALLYVSSLQIAIKKTSSTAWIFGTLAPVVMLVVVLGILLDPQAASVVRNYLDTTVFNKLDTDSGVERSSWNSLALRNFWDSWGLGVGVGTTRASSFLMALLSSVGIIGLILYGLFMYSVYLRPRGAPRSFESDVRMAARNAAAGLLVGDLLLAPSIDQGLFFYVLAGLAVAVPLRHAQTSPVSPAPWRAA